MAPQTLSFPLASADETAHRARQLGNVLRPGDVVLLEGDVGAGKTHFARSLILSLLEAPEDIPSPTFTLVQTYPTTRGEVWHADLYRLTTTFEIEELGLVEAFDTHICLVEWPDRLGDLAPVDALHLRLDQAEDPEARLLTTRWENGGWGGKLAAWLQ